MMSSAQKINNTLDSTNQLGFRLKALEHFKFSKFLYSKGEFEKALKHCLCCLSLSYNSASVHSYASLIYSKLTKLDCAEYHIIKALKITLSRHQKVKLLINLSAILIQLSKFNEALAILLSILHLVPKYPTALMNLSTLLRIIGYREQAIFLQWFFVTKLQELEVNQANVIQFGESLNNLHRNEAGYLKTIQSFKSLLPASITSKELQSNLIDELKLNELQKFEYQNDYEALTEFDNLQCELNKTPIDVRQMRNQNCFQLPLKIICVKWGNKYSVNDVHNLYYSVLKFLDPTKINYPSFEFICFTDKPKGLDSRIEVVEIPGDYSAFHPKGINQNQNFKVLKGWWSKLNIFYIDPTLDKHRCLYFDLDTLIISSINFLIDYTGPFGLISTDKIFSEKQSKSGYNSSIISWIQNKKTLKKLYMQFDKSSEIMVHRLDHWLEMNLCNVDFLDSIYPKNILDFRENLDYIEAIFNNSDNEPRDIQYDFDEFKPSILLFSGKLKPSMAFESYPWLQKISPNSP